MDFNDPFVAKLIDLAIAEDIGDGDHSSLGAIDSGVQGRARLIVKDNGVLCGVHLAEHILHRIDPNVKFIQLYGRRKCACNSASGAVDVKFHATNEWNINCYQTFGR